MNAQKIRHRVVPALVWPTIVLKMFYVEPALEGSLLGEAEYMRPV